MGKQSKETMVDNLFSNITGKRTNDFLLMNLKTISEHYINTKQLDFKSLIEMMKSRLNVTG